MSKEQFEALMKYIKKDLQENEGIYKKAGITQFESLEKIKEIERYMQEYRANWKDYYKILQVDPSITQDDIYLIYKRVHESYNPEAEKAWETLSDPIKRVAYDHIYKEKH